MSYVRRQRLSWARIKLSCLWYLYFILSNVINLNLSVFFKLLNFLLFIELKTFKKFYFFGTDFLVLKSYRFGLFSKGFTVYFSMYFLVLFCVERNLLYYKYFYFVKCFFESFFIFCQNKN